MVNAIKTQHHKREFYFDICSINAKETIMCVYLELDCSFHPYGLVIFQFEIDFWQHKHIHYIIKHVYNNYIDINCKRNHMVKQFICSTKTKILLGFIFAVWNAKATTEKCNFGAGLHYFKTQNSPKNLD